MELIDKIIPGLTAKKAAQLAEVRRLATELGVEILAHYFQRAEVKAAADLVGGAPEVIKRALTSTAPKIMLCGASYMTAELQRLGLAERLLIPRSDLSCPLAEAVTAEMLLKAKARHPQALIVADIKASPELRALADLEISPATVHEVLKASGNKPLIALPGPQLIDWAGFSSQVVERWPQALCQVHEQASLEDLTRAMAEHPQAKVLVHLLCRPQLHPLADFIGDSAGIGRYCAESPHSEFIIVCEAGMAEFLSAHWPEKFFYETETEIFCANMKLTTLKTMLNRLEEYAVTAEEDL